MLIKYVLIIPDTGSLLFAGGISLYYCQMFALPGNAPGDRAWPGMRKQCMFCHFGYFAGSFCCRGHITREHDGRRHTLHNSQLLDNRSTFNCCLGFCFDAFTYLGERLNTTKRLLSAKCSTKENYHYHFFSQKKNDAARRRRKCHQKTPAADVVRRNTGSLSIC